MPIEQLLSNPGLTMITGLGISTLIILADPDTGISIDLPGKGRLGLAGIIAVISATFYVYTTSGLNGIFNEIAKGIFTAVLVTPFVLWYLRN